MRPFTTLLCLLLMAPMAHTASAAVDLSMDTLVYVGTYTNTPKKSQGIYLFRLAAQNPGSPQSLPLESVGLAAESTNPSFLAIDPKHRFVFAVNEVDTFEGKPAGAVSAFAIDPQTGKLKFLNQKSALGTGPCHLVLDREGRHVFIANYGSGSVAVLRVEADGRLGETTAFIQHTGQSVNPQRQKGPHAHCVTLDPANKFAFVCDLGLDKVMAYRFDAQTGKLTPADPAFATVKPGSGPRHMVFRPDGKFAYVTNEMSSTVTTFAYDASSGRLTELQTVSSLPPSFTGKNSGAEIGMHPSGKWLYASNRGHDSVALFNIDPQKGTLTFTADQTTGGNTPRHFGLEPNARHLAIGNQGSDTVMVCRIDESTGRLTPSGALVEVPAPVCLLFVPPAAARSR